jgi:hypothetical protein
MTDANLVMHQTMVPDSRTPNKASQWRATCQVNGQEYAAVSRNGAPHALARTLVEAGIEDQSVVVVSEPVVGEDGRTRYAGGEMGFQSLHGMAGRSLVESATQPLHLARYREPDFGFAREPGGDGGRIAEKGVERRLRQRSATPTPRLPKTRFPTHRPAAPSRSRRQPRRLLTFCPKPGGVAAAGAMMHWTPQTAQDARNVATAEP